MQITNEQDSKQYAGNVDRRKQNIMEVSHQLLHQILLSTWYTPFYLLVAGWFNFTSWSQWDTAPVKVYRKIALREERDISYCSSEISLKEWSRLRKNKVSHWATLQPSDRVLIRKLSGRRGTTKICSYWEPGIYTYKHTVNGALEENPVT